MRRGWVFVITVSLMGPCLARGQAQDSTRSEVREDLEEALEGVAPQAEIYTDQQLIQHLLELAARPVNLNTADTRELLIVPGLNLKLVHRILAYRADRGAFGSVRELLEIRGIGRVTLEKVRPYVTAGRGRLPGRMSFAGTRHWTEDGRFQAFSRYQRDLQQAKGYIDPPAEGGYLGSPAKYYQRFGYYSDHLSANLTQQKDAGERLPGPTRFDYRSWHLALEDNGRLQMLVAGDYSLSFGQGLVLGSGGVFGKGSDITGAVNRSGRGVDPYTSAQETKFYRGAAVTYGGALQATGFFSRRSRSASEAGEDTMRAPRSDGYHRTVREHSQAGNLKQTLYGGNLQWEFPFGRVGATGYRTVFDYPVAASEGIYARYDFEGRSTSAFGLDYTLMAGPALLFGEAGRSQNGGWGFLTGVQSNIGEDTGLALAYRNYRKDFQSILGSGFGETSGQPQNEEGIYLGLEHAVNEQIALSAYVDQYRFPGPRFGVNQPSRGYDWLVKSEFELTSRLDVYLQLRSEIEEDEYEVEEVPGVRRELREGVRSSLRAHLEFRVNPRVRIRTRAEAVRSRPAGANVERGYLLYQDLRLELGEGFRLDTRLTLFDTQSYATRVYQFENDLLYVFASQALYNTGQRMYLLLNWEPLEFLELWAKYGVTWYEDARVIGSGLNRIEGDTRSEIGLQVRVRL